MIAVIMFVVCLLMLTLGYPVAFTFGGVAVFFGLYTQGLDLFLLVAYRMHAIMTNVTLMAVPLFIFMGLILEKSGIAERMLESMGLLFGHVRGGLAVSTVVVGMLLAASTGVVGASVVTMGLIALPVMLKYHYDKQLASGVICASGTLGQIIPPSIVLIILGDVLHQPVGDFYRAALLPGLLLVVLYVFFCLAVAYLKKEFAPPLPRSLAFRHRAAGRRSGRPRRDRRCRLRARAAVGPVCRGSGRAWRAGSARRPSRSRRGDAGRRRARARCPASVASARSRLCARPRRPGNSTRPR